jgi:hypothetical protein
MGAYRGWWVLAPLFTTAPAASAQSSSQAPTVTWLVGAEAAAYQTANPHGGTGGLGASIAIDWGLSRFVTVRTQIRGIRMVETADDTSICLLRREGGCWPDPVFPDQMWDVQAGALVRLWYAPRLWAVFTAGSTTFVGARESPRKALHDQRSRSRMAWHGGVELSLGSSRRAPRLRFTRSMYDRPTLDLTGLYTLALLFPL